MVRALAAAGVWLGVAVGLQAGCTRAPASPLDLDSAVRAAHELQQTKGPRAALPAYQKLLALARSRHSRRHEGVILGHLGTTYKNLGEYAQAMVFHGQALAIKREVGDPIEIGKTLSNMGLVEEAQGRC